MDANRLREVLDYDPETGAFTRKISDSYRPRIGRPAGSKTNYGYIRIDVDGQLHRAHRLAWLYVTGSWPEHQIDHINGKRDDNRWSNLRAASGAQNSQNSKKRKHNRSGFKGVSWKVKSAKWVAHIRVNGKSRHLGYFEDLNDAAHAYANAARDYFGEFACW